MEEQLRRAKSHLYPSENPSSSNFFSNQSPSLSHIQSLFSLPNFSVNSDPDHDPTITSIHKIEDGNIRNMLCVPVFDVNGSVIAVIQAVNKVEEGAAKANKSLRRTTISKGEMNLASYFGSKFKHRNSASSS